MNPAFPRRRGSTLWAALLLLLAGCKATKAGRADSSTRAGQEVVREELRTFTEYFSGRIQGAVEEIAEKTDDPHIRRQSIVWMLRAVPVCRRLAGHPDAIVGYFNTWLLCIQINRLLEGEVGAEAFGEYRPIAADAGRDVQVALEQIGLSHLSQEQLDEARRSIEAFANEQGLGEGVMMPSRTHDRAGVWAGLTSAAHLPMSIINPFRGIDEGALAVESATRAAERALDVVSDFPDRTRWQTELLLLNVSSSPVVQRALGQMDELNESAARIEDVAASLPASFREEGARLFEELDESSLALRASVTEVRETAADVRAAIADVDATLSAHADLFDDATRTGEAWEGAVRAFTETVRVLREPGDEEPAPSDADEEEGRPFDILDWAATAERLTETARELRSLLEGVQATVREDDLNRLTQSVDAAAVETVDHVALRIAQLVGLVLASALVYRFVAARIAS